MEGDPHRARARDTQAPSATPVQAAQRPRAAPPAAFETAQRPSSEPDGRDAGHHPEQEAQETERESVPGATVDPTPVHVDV
jgi:hypothetical protein